MAKTESGASADGSVPANRSSAADAPVAPLADTLMTSGHRGRTLLPVLIALVATALYGTLSTLQWRTLQAPSWDLGIFSELAKAYAEQRAPIVPIKGDGFNLLGDHFHPILVLLGPIWALWPSGLALLWTQAVLFGTSVIPIARLAIERLGTGLGSLAGIAYALSFGLQSAQAVQFHEIAAAVPLLAMSLTRLLRGRTLAACLWAAPLVLVKEDLGLTVLMLGVVIALRGAHHRRLGAALAAWGTAWFVLATAVILPLLNNSGQYDYVERLGSPWDALVPVEKWQTVVLLIAVAGGIGLRSPLMALMLPTLAWRFTGTVEFYWGWTWHYSAVLMPIAAAALLDAAPRMGPWSRRIAVLVSLAATAVLGPSLPLATLAQPATWQPTWRAAPAAAAMAAVPDGSTVATDITLMAPLVTDHDVQWIHGPNQRVPRCVVIDQFAFSWSGQPPASAGAWADEHYHQADGTFADTASDGGFTVACRGT